MNDFMESGIQYYDPELLGPSDRHYIQSYWLNYSRLAETWVDVLERVFVVRESSICISPLFEVRVNSGGLLFVEEEFKKFKRVATREGAKNFVVIEDIGQQSWSHPTNFAFFRFCYPLNITWNELAKSCTIAEDMFLRPIRKYFVITNDGRHGKYANQDAEQPYELEFIVVDPMVAST